MSRLTSSRGVSCRLAAALLVAIVLMPCMTHAAPLVYLQVLARLDGTDNAFTSSIAPTPGQEYDYIVVATLAPAGTQNTNLPVDGNGNQTIGSWQSGTSGGIPSTDGLGGTVYAMFENPSASSQVSFQSPGYQGAGGNSSIDPNIYAGVKTKRTAANSTKLNGNATFTGGVNTISYTYSGVSGFQGTSQTLIPSGVGQSSSGYALFANYGQGTGAQGGNVVNRANGNSDLANSLSLGNPATYYGVDPNIIGPAGSASPITVILQSGSNQGSPIYNGGGSDPNGNDSTILINSVGVGTSKLNINTYDMNPGNPGFALRPTDDFLNLQYHDTTGALVRPGHVNTLQYSAETDSDPVVKYTGLTIIGDGTIGPTSVLNFTPTTYSFGSVLKNGVATATLVLNNTPGNGTDTGTYSGVESNDGITASNSGAASVGNNLFTVTLNTDANGTTTSGTKSWTYTVTNTTPGNSDTGGNKTATISAIIGNATADTSNQQNIFGTPLTAVVAQGASYAGLSSTVTGGDGATNPGPGPLAGTSGGPVEHTTATILTGNNTQSGEAVQVSMAWRTRNLNETGASQGGSPTNPPLLQGLSLHSDVVSLNMPDDLMVLQMSYDPSDIGGITEQNSMVLNGTLYLGIYDPYPQLGYPGWENVSTFLNAHYTGFIGSFAAYQSLHGTDIDNYEGAWGVDTTDDQAWAVMEAFGFGPTDLAVVGDPPSPVPEPGTVALMAAGLVGLLGARRGLDRSRGKTGTRRC